MSNSETAEAQAPDDELSGPDSPQELAFSKTDKDAEALYFNWHKWALDKQRPPAGDWTTWLLLGGRGAGKTRAGAEWVRGLAARGVSPIALVGETMTEAVSIIAVKRVIALGSPAALYSSAEQLLDFGSLPGAFTLSVAQLSPVLGAGHPASGDFDGSNAL